MRERGRGEKSKEGGGRTLMFSKKCKKKKIKVCVADDAEA